jgi:hypothetical protein
MLSCLLKVSKLLETHPRLKPATMPPFQRPLENYLFSFISFLKTAEITGTAKQGEEIAPLGVL